MPKSVMPFIMVEVNNNIQAQWRTGIILKHYESQALISSYSRRLRVTVVGERRQRQELLTIIRYLVGAINKKLNVNPDLLVPLPGTNEYADYDELKERAADGEKYYTLYKPVKKKFLITNLIEGIPPLKTQETNLEKINQLLDNQEKMLFNQQILLEQHEAIANDLLSQLANSQFTTTLLEEIQTINQEQAKAINDNIMQFVTKALFLLDEELDEKFQSFYQALKESDHYETKLKIGLPLAQLTGVNLSTTIDLKGWAKEMYKKHELKIFQLMGHL